MEGRIFDLIYFTSLIAAGILKRPNKTNTDVNKAKLPA